MHPNVFQPEVYSDSRKTQTVKHYSSSFGIMPSSTYVVCLDLQSPDKFILLAWKFLSSIDKSNFNFCVLCVLIFDLRFLRFLHLLKVFK